VVEIEVIGVGWAKTCRDEGDQRIAWDGVGVQAVRFDFVEPSVMNCGEKRGYCRAGGDVEKTAVAVGVVRSWKKRPCGGRGGPWMGRTEGSRLLNAAGDGARWAGR